MSPFARPVPVPQADAASWLQRLAECAVRAVHPDSLLPGKLPAPPAGRTLVVGAGKAAAAMATALERAWQVNQPEAPLSGLVVTRYGHGPQEQGPQGQGAECRLIEVLEASHPMPDDLSERAARRNVEYLLGLFKALEGAEGIHALAIDTDGIDGSEDNAKILEVIPTHRRA